MRGLSLPEPNNRVEDWLLETSEFREWRGIVTQAKVAKCPGKAAKLVKFSIGAA